MSYKITPPLPRSGAVGVKRHEEAGRFKTKLQTAAEKKKIRDVLKTSDVYDLTEAASRNYKSTIDPELATAWKKLFSKFSPLSIGKSAYGDVYTVVVDAVVLDFLKLAAEKGSHRVRGRTPKLGEKIAVKLVKRRLGMDYSTFVRENVLEATSHERMSSEDSCFEIPCAPGVKNCASDHIPTFYFAYLAEPSVYATFMSMAGTTTLTSYLTSKRQKLDAKMYASIEKSVAVMWASGFTHADLHSGNILVNPSTKEAWVIDFGFAVRLPMTLRDLVRKRIGDTITRGGSKSLGELWKEKDPASDESLSSFTNKATQSKGISGWYNPNGRAVLLHYNKMSASERAKFDNVRRQLWGCKPMEYPVSGGAESELEEGEIRPPPKKTNKPTNAAKYDLCKRKCEAIGKVCNPRTFRCIKPKPAPNSVHDACKDKCGAVDKVCNPVTLRCITIPGMAAPTNEAGPAHGPETARNLVAIEKRLKRIPKGGLKKYLEEKRAKCLAEGKKFNPTTGRCVKATGAAKRVPEKNAPGPETARNLAAIEKRLKRVPKGGLKKYLDDKRAKCAAEGKKFNPLTGRCIKK